MTLREDLETIIEKYGYSLPPDQILSLIREHIKGIENPYGDAVKRAREAGDTFLASIYEDRDAYRAFEVAREAVLLALSEAEGKALE